MSLVKLPYELVAFVVHHLDLADVCSLSRSCRHFLYLLYEPSITKVLLETKAPETLEARSARVSNRHAAELRRLIKRREAIASVSPYLVAIVAHAQTWIYQNGLLCYICDRELRILDIHRSARSEIVVNIRLLLNQALVESRKSTKYKFRLYYCSHDIISCVFTHQVPIRTSWLVVFNAKKQQIITVHRLDALHKLFVRNNDKFLYYGTHTEVGPHGSRNWVIKGYDMAAGRWIEGALILTDFLGSDIGTTVCFEILGGHFYGLSNKLDPAVEERDWTSYYTCFRYPLEPCGLQNLEYVPCERLWRRQHTDGPIDERWSFLRLFRDEATSQLKVVEARKEWLSGQSSAKRTYYTKTIIFGDANNESTQDPSEWDSNRASDYPVTGKGDQKNFRGPPSRDPHMVHVGDDAAKCLMFTSSKCPLRLYYSSCQTFIDLVDDPSSFSPDKQRIRIRGSSRRLWTPAELEERNRFPTPETHESQHTLAQKIESLYKHEDVVLWPPEEHLTQPNPALCKLYEILNPPSQVGGNITGVWDERSLVYATVGPKEPLNALVLISWDPSIYLDGVVQYPDLPSFGRSTSSQNTEVPTSSHLEIQAPDLYVDTGKGKEDDDDWLEPNVTQHPNTSRAPNAPGAILGDDQAQWRVFESPKCQTYSSGYHFARLKL